MIVTLAERIDLVIREMESDNAKAFSEKTGINVFSLSKWRHGERVPNRKHLDKILRAYPMIQEEWMIEGKGKPFIGKRAIATNEEILERLDSLDKKLDDIMSVLAQYGK